MFKIELKNSKSFICSGDQTIFEAAKIAGLILEHSCLSARCKSCMAKVVEGETIEIGEDLVLSRIDKQKGYILTCNTKPLSDVLLNIDDIDNVDLTHPKTVPSKIDTLEFVNKDVVKLVLRTPPNSSIDFLSGQYVNIIMGSIKRSYSLAAARRSDHKLEFFIKNYKGGVMSNYLFESAKINDVLRLEGPLGTFFYRHSKSKNIVFLATGTGIAPVKSILDQFDGNPDLVANKNIWVLWGARHEEDLFWAPKYQNIKLHFIPVLSRINPNWEGATGYVQNVLQEHEIDLSDTQVYACGSNDMINSAFKLLAEKGLPENQFYSDAFVSSN